MSGIWESARHGVPVWPGMPAGSPSPATYYAPPAIGGDLIQKSGSSIVGVARAVPFILDKPRRVQSVGVYSGGSLSGSPGDTWEFGIYNDRGDTLLWSGTLSGVGLSKYTAEIASVELDMPQRFIVTLGLITSNGASYYAKNNGGNFLPGWYTDAPVASQGGLPIQGPTGLPPDLSGFGSATLSGVDVSVGPIFPIVRVYS